MTRDVLYGLRSFVRHRSFASLVVVILAVGIGFVTMVASLAHSVFLGAVPYDVPERIVVVWRQGPEPVHEREATSYLNIRDWAAGGKPFFEGLAAYTIAPASIVEADGARRVMVTYVDPYFFDALDIDMTVGRRLSDEDNRPPSGDAVVVVSHGLWQSALGGDPAIVGRTINLSGRQQTVVGVMSPRTRWLLHEPLDVVAPYRNAAVAMGAGVIEDRGAPTSIAVGRLRKGIGLSQAQSGMQVVSLALQQQYQDTNAGIGARVTSFADLRSGFGRLSEVVTILGIAAGLVFFLSCTSVTLLLLARFLERTQEFACLRIPPSGRSSWRVMGRPPPASLACAWQPLRSAGILLWQGRAGALQCSASQPCEDRRDGPSDCQWPAAICSVSPLAGAEPKCHR